MQRLPIDSLLPSIVDSLTSFPALVLQSPTGSGKTTRVPIALMETSIYTSTKILMVVPRRIAARSAAHRMAETTHTKLGEEIGYHVRFDKKCNEQTKIIVLTEGMYLQYLQRDPFLEDVGCVIFDEFHERSLNLDLCFAMTRKVQQEANEDLHIIVMSATIDPSDICAYLGACPSIEGEGRQHPVEVRYLERDEDLPLHVLTAKYTRKLAHETDDDILVFLPGVRDILNTQEQLAQWAETQGILLLPLYGELPLNQQRQVITPQSSRRIILATNIAESSLTIDGVGVVIDSGLCKQMHMDWGHGMNRLETKRISLASAEQRKGRAGRTKPGICLRLWTSFTHRQLDAHAPAEIHRVDCTAAFLELYAWGETDIQQFPWYEPPSEEAREDALRQLHRLNALQANTLTPEGRKMANLPVSPRLAACVLQAHTLGHTRSGCLLAARISERSPYKRTQNRPETIEVVEEVLTLTQHLRTPPKRSNWKPGVAKQIEKIASSMYNTVQQTWGNTPDAMYPVEEALRRAILAGFPDRVARRRAQKSHKAVTVEGKGVRLFEPSPSVDTQLFVCVHTDAGSRQQKDARVYLASVLEESWLPQQHIHEETIAVFDEASGKVIGKQRRRFLDLVLEEQVGPTPSPDACATALAEAAREQLKEALQLDEKKTAQWLARVACLRQALPELAYPAFDEEQLISWLPEICYGLRSFAELQKFPLLDYLKSKCTREQLQCLEKEAPTHIEVPSGSRIRLSYDTTQAHPVLAVRIQELFGCHDTPRIARGRLEVLIHLLAPNMRPQQVTTDLRSFWENTYTDVRKELRQRYPKHAWPEDPWTAKAEKRPQRKKK